MNKNIATISFSKNNILSKLSKHMFGTNLEHIGDAIYINGISYISLCEHHMMPFHGSASIAVFPKKKILGISKFSDLVGHFSNDLTLQEKLTEKIASFIHKTLDADGVFVKMSAKHLCSDLLNSQNSSEEVITTYSTGVYELDFSLRNEALLNFT